jgi:aryl-alcohol dehydrogenase-like predicted oxidoreductase
VKKLIDTGKFSLINVIYTLLNPTAVTNKPQGMDVSPDFGQVIPYGAARGVGSAIYSPLAGGLLTDQIINGGSLHPLSRGGRDGVSEARQKLVQQASAFRFLAEQTGGTLAQAATRFILTDPGVTAVLGGFSDAQQVEEIAAASDAGPLSPELIGRIEGVWRANFAS